MIWALAADTEPVVRLTPQARIIGAVLAIAFMALILDLIRRDKLLERYSIVWFLLGIGMLLGAIFPVALEWLAKAMGVRDVTIALFSVTLLILLALSLNFSVIASRQSKQITRLAQQQAIDGVEEEAASPAASSRGETPAPREQAPR
ncbi:MAG TPA: DUF2304 domain-containing protein [Solirubrobacterales bacterium]|nr:DUF2304 domain-containing protein [Solirubrobacterales bacterium]HMW45552.1 DUF2304 domain-containing protein [Solirubrobacterales bacterium]HMX70984.1 DUF2304 domain-containing protein [Solirubrobacterales bacterium]HMY26876.1 DUF2304 domain-containing protein [Solirubrobacterales bacterium]HNA24730.1 DUF2304 domain-containing protein [Solirubrobacterales bacterium]